MLGLVDRLLWVSQKGRKTISRTRSAIIAITALALTTTPAIAKPKPYDSWGRAGVDFETYRKDALECALSGYYADVSETEHAKKFVRATRRLEAADDSSMGMPLATPQEDIYRMATIAARSEQIRSSIRPEKLMRELQGAMVGLVEDCLVERGYLRFRLTADQQKELSHLKKGTPERHHFLHALASDPDVLDTQALHRKS